MVTQEVIEKFEILRPYNDQEAKEIIKRILENEYFYKILKFLNGNGDVDFIIKSLKNANTIEDFQMKFSNYVINKVLELSVNNYTFGGIDNLDINESYLFVANHRDIVLDSALMQYALVKSRYKTSQITFGSNLMSSQFIIDLGKMNKMFTLYRGGNRLEQYKNAILHSAYIYDVIKNKKESVWIAQRDGRTKDGMDKTQLSLLKMFSLTADKPFDRLQELNIVPVAISYEYETCDAEKTKELYIKDKTKNYVKGENEDYENIIIGIKSFKGNVHLEFGKPLNKFIESVKNENISDNDKFGKIGLEIDRQVYVNYRLHSTNYIAYDLLNNVDKFKEHYTIEQKNNFETYMVNKLKNIGGDFEILKHKFLNIYSNPVSNSLNYIAK